jgi:hypothetical protein
MTDYGEKHKPYEIRQVTGTEYDICVDQVIINVKTKVDTTLVKYVNSYIKIASLGLFEGTKDQYYVSIPVFLFMDYLNE